MMSTTRRMAEGSIGRHAAALALAAVLAACAPSGPAADAADDGPAASASPLGSYLAARHAQQVRDYSSAAMLMGHALDQDPDNFDLVRRTFLLRVSEGHVTEAVPLAQRIVDVDRNATLAQVVLLLQDVKDGNFAGAVKRARALPNDGAQQLATPLLVAWCEAGLERPAPALQALDALDALKGVQTLKELHAAMLADYVGRTDESDRNYKSAIADQQHLTWRTAELAGNFYERHQRSEDARRLYERVAAGDQGEEVAGQALARIARGELPPPIIASARDGVAEALFDLASILDQRETIDAALIYARLALDMRPDFPLAQMLIAEIAEDQQHVADALQLYRAIDPRSVLSWSARLRAATALDTLNRTDEAAAELHRMADERPKEPQPLVELGDILRGRSRFVEAIAAYDAAIGRVEHIEARHWRLYYSRAVALERASEWPRAEADLRHALDLQPDQPLVLNYLGYSWIDKGQNLEQGLKMVKRAVELRPNDGYIVDSLGWAYYRLHDFSSATQYLEHAIELLPEDPTVNDHLGDAYWQQGRATEARYQWRRALQFKPEADQAKTIENKLDRGLAKLPASSAMRGG